jgi:hypothetical protein
MRGTLARGGLSVEFCERRASVAMMNSRASLFPRDGRLWLLLPCGLCWAHLRGDDAVVQRDSSRVELVALPQHVGLDR